MREFVEMAEWLVHQNNLHGGDHVESLPDPLFAPTAKNMFPSAPIITFLLRRARV